MTEPLMFRIICDTSALSEAVARRLNALGLVVGLLDDEPNCVRVEATESEIKAVLS